MINEAGAPSAHHPSIPLRRYAGPALFFRRMKEVVISTEAVNSYGTRILTAGIDLVQYQRNPVLLWMHRRSYQDTAGPIGRIENLRREGDKLIGTPVFDQNDPFAKQVESKWETVFCAWLPPGLNRWK